MVPIKFVPPVVPELPVNDQDELLKEERLLVCSTPPFDTTNSVPAHPPRPTPPARPIDRPRPRARTPTAPRHRPPTPSDPPARPRAARRPTRPWSSSQRNSSTVRPSTSLPSPSRLLGLTQHLNLINHKDEDRSSQSLRSSYTNNHFLKRTTNNYNFKDYTGAVDNTSSSN